MHTRKCIRRELHLLCLKVNYRQRNLFFRLSPGAVNSIYSYAHGLAMSGTGHVVSLMFTVCLLQGPSLPNHVPSTSCLHTLSHGLCVSLYPFSLTLPNWIVYHFPSPPDTHAFSFSVSSPCPFPSLSMCCIHATYCKLSSVCFRITLMSPMGLHSTSSSRAHLKSAVVTWYRL